VSQQTLNLILLAEKHSRVGGLNAKQVSRLLKHRRLQEYQQRGEDEFYWVIRYRIEKIAPDKKLVNLETPEWHSVPDTGFGSEGSAWPAAVPNFVKLQSTRAPTGQNERSMPVVARQKIYATMRTPERG
jgi:hypothetical protein